MVGSASRLTLEDEDLIGSVVKPEKPVPLESLQASASRITSRTLEKTYSKSRSTSGKNGWREDAWDMFDLVGEQRFLATTLANRMGQARFFVGKLPKDNTEDVEVVTEGPAYQAGQSILGAGNHFNQLVTRAGINLFIPGEGFLLGKAPEGGAESESGPPSDHISPVGKDVLEGGDVDLSKLEWSFFSSDELSINKEGKVSTTAESPCGSQKFSADEVVLIRIWRSHPRKWADADSPTRSSLPVLRELVGLTMHISAQVDSRLAGAGVFLVPASANAALKAAMGPGVESENPFGDALLEAMVKPISDRSNASAVVPLTVVVPDDAVDKFKHITMAGPLDQEARSLRDEAIRRLALGQDCPPELLLGVAGMNHWGAWLVRDDVVTTHLEPPLAIFCDAISREFLWPVLEAAGVEDAKSYVFWYDVEHLIQRPNRSQDANSAHSAGVISDMAYRDALGFDESDAPEVSEKNTDPVIDMVLQMVQRAPNLVANPGLPNLARQVRALLADESTTPTEAEQPAGDGEGDPVTPEPDETGATEGGIPATDGAPADV